MRKNRAGITYCLVTLLVAFVAGCGREVVTVPSVVSVIPAQDATTVAVNTTISATFSMAMNPATINATTFTVTGPSGAAVAGSVTYSGSTATFTPTANLAYSTVYTATIIGCNDGVKTLGGTPMIANYVWTFTTGTAPAVVSPEIVSTVPANAASGTALNQVLSASFSEAMNPATISSATFTVTGPGGAALAGSVTYAGTTATFTPAAPLAYNSIYTATITTGVTSQAGVPLSGNYVWSFSTASPALAVISTVPVNTATGVPIGQALSASFSEAMSPSSITTSTFTVTGSGGAAVTGSVTYSGTTAMFTPAAPLAYNSTYTATITTGVTSQAGVPLSGNYVWSFSTASPALAVISTVPVNTATGVPVSQVVSATFNEAMNCAAFPAAAFTVTGPGATPVPGTIGCSGTVATFTPAADLATNTIFTATITTAALDLAGNALAGNYVWTFRTVPAPTLPTVISTAPVNGAIAVPTNQAVSGTFSEAMTPATVNAATFTLTVTGGASVTGVVTYVAAGSAATFTPDANLAPGTQYTATITTGAEDLAGNALAGNYVWTFTTAALPVVVPPTVISTIPAGLATGVPFNQIVNATFSTAMDPATINATTFTLTGPGATPVAGLVAYAAIGNTLTFTPAANLAPNTTFTATITTGARNLAGTPLANNYVWTFTTGTAPAVVSLEIVSTVPANAASGAALNQAASATFTEAMNPLTITTATFTVAGPGGAPVAGTVSYDAVNFIATFTPTVPLAASTTYIATITSGATDLAGNPLGDTGAPNPWSFTTAAAAPTVTVVVPANGAMGVPVGQALSASFSEAMNPLTITTATFTVAGPGGGAVAGSVAYVGTTATFTPAAALSYNTTYTATITTGVTSLAGVPLAGDYVWSFSTMASTPAVIATVPVNGATGVPIGQALSASFSEAMSPSSITTSTFTVTGPGGAAVTGSVTYAGTTATFTPAVPLAYNATYTATITTGTTSLAGVPLAGNYAWSFSTASPALAVISTVPVNTATGVPVSQVLSATFNEAMNCATFPAAAFTVTGPGTTPIPGTIGCSSTVATFTPAADLATNTVFTATTTTAALDLAGNALAGNYVWTFRTVPAPTLPTVISTAPVNGAIAVATNQAVSGTFSEAMNPATINAATFLLTVTGGASVTGVVTYVAAGSAATFTPDANLAPGTQYTATITTGAEDLAGNALAGNYVWTFTTAALPVVVPPTVISTIPAGLATGVPFNQIVNATFSTAMDPATINATTFTLTGPGATPVAGLVAYAAIGNTLTFTPAANLAPNTTFTATITTGARNLAGTPLANNYVWTFTTGTAPAVVSLEIVSTVPANAASGAALNQAASATFTEAMNPLTITTATFTVAGPGGAPVAGTVSYDAVNFIATFTPTVPLAASTTYIATITSGATDLAGNPLGNTGAPNPWSFTTAAAVIPPPIILGPTISLFAGFGSDAGMTNQGTSTVINGAIGTTGASTTMTGFYDESVAAVAGVYPCSYTVTSSNLGLVNGTIETAPLPPSDACPNEGTATTLAAATEAALEARTAYTTLQGLTSTGLLATELGGTTIYPGVYINAGSVGITTGPLTLDAQGNPNAYWIFQIGASLTVGTPTAPESVNLINGAQAGNVFWAVGGFPGAVINYGGGGTMVGTIISRPGITVSSPGVAAVTTINGRVLALNASVTVVNTVINVPAP